MKPQQVHLIPWFALTIIVSACVAIVATVIMSESLDQYAGQLQQEDNFLRISQERPDPLPGSYEEALSYVKEQAGDRAFFTYKQTSTDLSSQDVRAVGAVVTTDGWTLIAGNVDLSIGHVGWINGKPYEIDDVITMEPFMLAHLKEATGLVPFSFGISDEVASGEYVFAFEALESFSATTLTNAQSIDASVARASSDYKQTAAWVLQDDLTNALVVNVAGDLVAVATDGDVYPIHYGIPWLQSVIRGEAYVVPRLGVSVRWLDALLVNTSDRTSGAFVLSVHDDASVFVAGDVITRVGNRLIDAHTPIAETVLGYNVGEMIAVTFVRDGETQEVEVELLGDSLIY